MKYTIEKTVHQDEYYEDRTSTDYRLVVDGKPTYDVISLEQRGDRAFVRYPTTDTTNLDRVYAIAQAVIQAIDEYRKETNHVQE